MSRRFEIVDSHVHACEGAALEGNLLALMEAAGLGSVNVAALPSGAIGKYSNYETACAALLAKLRRPGRFYSFHSLLYRKGPDGSWIADFKEQAEAALAAGADGFKMLEGKPDVRKSAGVPLDSPLYGPFYSLLEAKGVPLLLHVADPEEFWDRAKAPDWAVKNGWFWGDGSFNTKESLYAEVDGLLLNHPKLKLTLAHFYFLSADLERAQGFLSKHPNVSFDITPGTEMFFNFSKRRQDWRGFFTENAGRVIFGSDCTDDPKSLDYFKRRIANIRSFLETKESYEWGRGIGLRPEALERIYSANFKALAGGGPKPVAPEALRELCERTMLFADEKSKRGLEEIAKLLPKG